MTYGASANNAIDRIEDPRPAVSAWKFGTRVIERSM